MRKYLVVAALVTGGYAIVGPLEFEQPPSGDQIDLFENHKNAEDVDDEQGYLAIEVSEDGAVVLPREDHGDEVTVLELAVNSIRHGLDVAGVQRTAGGRVVDAPPGSLDAALTGMQHDAGGTVTNTVSPEPTPSQIVAERLAEDPEIQEEGAPSADPVEEEEND